MSSISNSIWVQLYSDAKYTKSILGAISPLSSGQILKFTNLNANTTYYFKMSSTFSNQDSVLRLSSPGALSDKITVNWYFTTTNTITTDSTLSYSISLEEGIKKVATIQSDYNVSLGGTDASAFTLTNNDNGTQTLEFDTTVEYNSAKDSNLDNKYVIQLTLPSSAKNDMVLTLNLNVIEIVEMTNYSRQKKTGQKTSHTKQDDGFFTKGIDANFSRSSDIVTDHITNLKWLDDTTPTSGAYDFNSSQQYCNETTVGGLTWRVPSVYELATIVEHNSSRTTKMNPIFVNTDPQYSFVSSDEVNSTHFAVVNFGYGYSHKASKENLFLLRCVSSDNNLSIDNTLVILDANLTRDDEKLVVNDNKSHLMWSDDNTTTQPLKEWADAVLYCAALKDLNYTDWRLPTINELMSTIDVSTNKILTTFQKSITANFWSSTTHSHDSKYALALDPLKNSFEAWGKKALFDVRCVRDFE
jgi:hypothetical protein